MVRKLFIEVQAATCVPSTEKCIVRQKASDILKRFKSVGRNLGAIAACSSRWQFIREHRRNPLRLVDPEPDRTSRFSKLKWQLLRISCVAERIV